MYFIILVTQTLYTCSHDVNIPDVKTCLTHLTEYIWGRGSICFSLRYCAFDMTFLSGADHHFKLDVSFDRMIRSLELRVIPLFGQVIVKCM